VKPEWLKALPVWWGDHKIALERWLGLTSDAVHIHVGVLLYLGWSLLLRAKAGDWRPWALTLVIEAANECIDLFQPVGSIEANWPASRHDLLNTMALPSLLFLVRIAERSGRKHKRR
jgi:hypothetical protein